MHTVTQPLYESRMNWISDPAPPAFRRPATEAAPTPAPAILETSPGAPSTQPRRQKSRRRRRRKAARPANHNSASRQAYHVTPDERSANHNSAPQRSTQPRSNDLPETKSTPVEHPHSFHSSRLSQPPIPATNQNSGFPTCQDHSEFWGLYKPAKSDPREDLTATLTRDNISGFGLSSPALKQPLLIDDPGHPRCWT